jgi:hypothetical protein
MGYSPMPRIPLGTLCFQAKPYVFLIAHRFSLSRVKIKPTTRVLPCYCNITQARTSLIKLSDNWWTKLDHRPNHQRQSHALPCLRLRCRRRNRRFNTHCTLPNYRQVSGPTSGIFQKPLLQLPVHMEQQQLAIPHLVRH